MESPASPLPARSCLTLHLRVVEFLVSIDKQLFLFLNGKHNSFFDFIMFWSSNKFIWAPLYLFLLLRLIKVFGSKTVFLLLLIAAMITVSDQVSSTFVKAAVHRLRPCHNPELAGQVHLVNGVCGGTFGYFSSHASNSWALAVFLVLVFSRQQMSSRKDAAEIKRTIPYFSLALLFYALLISYSRIYLGTHYPADVFTGIVFGSFLSFIFANIFFKFQKNKVDA